MVVMVVMVVTVVMVVMVVTINSTAANRLHSFIPSVSIIINYSLILINKSIHCVVVSIHN